MKTSYSISFTIAKKGKSCTIGEEIILPLIKDVIENVMKKNSQLVLRYIPLSANTVQRCIDEMADDEERTFTSEHQHLKFSIQLYKITFSGSNIFIIYMKYHSPSLKCIADEFLLAKYLKGDTKSESMFRGLFKETQYFPREYYCSSYRECTRNGWPLQRISRLTQGKGYNVHCNTMGP